MPGGRVVAAGFTDIEVALVPDPARFNLDLKDLDNVADVDEASAGKTERR